MDQYAPIARMRHRGPLPLGTAVTLGVCAILIAGFAGVSAMRVGSLLTGDDGFAPYVLMQMGWVLGALVVLPRLTLGVQHAVSVGSTLRGIAMAWPELILSSMYFMGVWQAGYFAGNWTGPLALAMAVGFGEEILFRVMLLGWLVSKLPVLPALLLSSVIFGIVHATPLTPVTAFNTIPQTAGGLLYGAIYLRTRNPLAPAIVHGLWDFPIFVQMFNAAPALADGVAVPGVLPVGTAVTFTLIGAWGLWLMRPLIGIGDCRQDQPESAVQLRAVGAPQPTFEYGTAPPASQMAATAPLADRTVAPATAEPAPAGTESVQAFALPSLRLPLSSAAEEVRASSERTTDRARSATDDHPGRTKHRRPGKTTGNTTDEPAAGHDHRHGSLPKFRLEPVRGPNPPGLLGS